jgi:N-acetyl-anhydromuramoyl-L-alanine amidase
MAARAGRKAARVPAAARPRFAVVRATHRLRGARYVRSPNCDARPDPADISLLLVHAISLPPGQFGGPWIDRLFTNRLDPQAHPYFHQIRELKVSSHLCIARSGAVTQYVPFDQRAWHAGASRFDGRGRCNDFSIGIELEGTDEVPFEPRQYRRLAEIARLLMRAYPSITPARIVGHSDVAPGRKTDPGPHFDWIRLHAEIEALA